jgi:alpha-1,3-mannosyltransferase
MAVAYTAVMLFQRKKWIIGSCVLSLGVSIKMNVLLFIPGLLVLLVGGTKLSVSILSLVVFFATQILIACTVLANASKRVCE